MPLGKSDQPKRRHRPKKEVVVDEEKMQEEREKKLNSQLIPTMVSIVGSIAMLGIVAVGAPYSYGSQKVYYGGGTVTAAKELQKMGTKERDAANPALLIDFTTVITPVDTAPTAASKRVARACSQGRANTLEEIRPDEVHDAFKKATRFITCAMQTEPQRLCLAEERAFLVDQLMEYKERRQNVMAFEIYRDKEIEAYELYRTQMREGGIERPPLDMPKDVMPKEIDPGLLAQLEWLVKNGFIGPVDFGYYGFYVPEEYQETLKVGADRYAPCEIRT